MLRPHTAGATEMSVLRTRQRSFSSGNLKFSTSQRFKESNAEKSILRSCQNGGTFQNNIHFRRFSLGPFSHEYDSKTEVSVYKNIAHLFQTNINCSREFPKTGSSYDVKVPGSQILTSRKKVIRFLDAFDNDEEQSSKTYIGASEVQEPKNNERGLGKVPRERKDTANDLVHSNDDYRETSIFTGSSCEKDCKTSQSDDESISESLTAKSFCREKSENTGGCGTMEKESPKESLVGLPANINNTEESYAQDICDRLEQLSTQPTDQIHFPEQSMEGAKANEQSYHEEKNAFRSKKHKTKIKRCNSNYDADLEKSDKYLHAQSLNFTQTSQYMSNTKRGLSRLSVHYSQTNTAHNDRVIMADLLKNGHTRNALIGDSVYAIERRLYNRRRDPVKSTTFYDRFATQTKQKFHTLPARKRKSRTVADRAKERQERINKKKEELEHSFPPRAWSLVEVGAEDIEHMLNTCRYLRVDIRKQPNVYGIVDLSDEI